MLYVFVVAVVVHIYKRTYIIVLYYSDIYINCVYVSLSSHSVYLSMYYILSMCGWVCVYFGRFCANNVNLHMCSCLVLNIVSITVELMSCCLSCHICSLSAHAHNRHLSH